MKCRCSIMLFIGHRSLYDLVGMFQDIPRTVCLGVIE